MIVSAGLTAVMGLLLAGQVRAIDTVEAVEFTGNRTFSGSYLSTAVSIHRGSQVTERMLLREADDMELFYQDMGFYEVEVGKKTRRGRKKLIVTFVIDEGPRARVRAIELSGNVSVASDRLLHELSVTMGDPASAVLLQKGIPALRTFYLNSGYPFVEVAGTLSRTDSAAVLHYVISEGPRCRVRAVQVRGNRRVSTWTIRRASEIRTGELFSQRRLYDAQRRLYATKLFSRVVFAVARPDTLVDSIDVRFGVFEQAARGVAFGAGVESPPTRLLLSTEWEHNNVLNRGQTLALAVDYSPDFVGNFRVAGDVTYRVPYLVLTRIDFQTRPFGSWQRLDSIRLLEYGLETGMSRNLSDRLKLGISNRLRFVSYNTTGVTNSLGLTSQYDSRNELFDPSAGVAVQALAEAAGGILRGTNDFCKLTGDVRWYHGARMTETRLTSGDLVLAVRGMAGQAFPYGRADQVPYYESYTLGGRNSLRGYRDQSLGPDSTAVGQYRYGPAVANANVELRGPYIMHWVGVVVFFDAGGVAREFRSLDVEYSAGAGIRVRTPIGPVRLDIGKRLKNPPPGDRPRWYLGLLHAF